MISKDLLQQRREKHKNHFMGWGLMIRNEGRRLRNGFLSSLWKKPFLVCIIVIVMILGGCQQKTARTIDMYNASDDMVGTVKLTEEPSGVKAKVKVGGVSSGFHGIHVHEFPECSGPDFKSAGNHWNPLGKQHGLMNAKGSHLGDLPNIKVGSNGKMKGEVTIQEATLLDGKKSLLKGKGTSIVFTEDFDDGMTQPGGDSGKRIICGTIKKNPDKGKESPTDPTESE